MGNSVPEKIWAEIVTRLDAGTLHAFGERERYVHAPAPRVVCVPQGAPTIEQPDRHGDQGFTTVGRILLLRRFVMHFYCHGLSKNEDEQVDFGPAEDLYLDVLRAARNYAHNAVRFSDERWLDQEDGADGHVKYGSLIVFTATFDLPVYAARGQRVTLQATPPIDTTHTMNGEER